MNIYYLFDGHNELGPFELTDLMKQKLTRNTPIRMMDTDKWVPAEKLPELTSSIINMRFNGATQLFPAVRERANQFHSQRPKFLSTFLFIVLPLIAGITAYKSIKQLNVKPVQQQASASTPVIMQASMVASSKTLVEPDAGPAFKVKTIESTLVLSAKSEKKSNPIKKEPAKEDQTKQARLRWRNLFTVTNSNYGIGVMGGIKDLSVIINNQSNYVLDEVVAKITYVKANGEIWKSKLVTLNAIGPHDAKKELVPDVNRGKKAVVSLEKVVSKQMHFKYSASENKYGGDDPYLLR